jgi:hypothetical protein
VSRTTVPPRSHAAAQFQHAAFTPEQYLVDCSLHRAIDQAPQVTNAMFRQRARRFCQISHHLGFQ